MRTASLTTTSENKVLRYLAEGVDTGFPAALFLAGFTADPGETGNSVELSGDGYERLDVSGLLEWDAVNHKLILNADAYLAAATADWPSLAYTAICESGTEGANDLVLVADVPTPRVTVSGSQFFVESDTFEFHFTTAAGMFDEAKDLAGKWLFQAATAVTAGTTPAAWHMSVWTSTPGDDESGTEVETRVQLTGGTALSVTASRMSFGGDVSFLSMSAARDLTHVAIHTASTGTGNGLFHLPLDATVSLLTGDNYTFPAAGSYVDLS